MGNKIYRILVMIYAGLTFVAMFLGILLFIVACIAGIRWLI